MKTATIPSVNFIHVGDTFDKEDNTLIYISKDALPVFKHMIQRACNTWQDIPPEIRELKDTLIPIGSDYSNLKQVDFSICPGAPLPVEDHDWRTISPTKQMCAACNKVRDY